VSFLKTKKKQCLNSSHTIVYVLFQKFFDETKAKLQNMPLGNEQSHHSARCVGGKQIKKNGRNFKLSLHTR
jgi:hypothetical protein